MTSRTDTKIGVSGHAEGVQSKKIANEYPMQIAQANGNAGNHDNRSEERLIDFEADPENPYHATKDFIKKMPYDEEISVATTIILISSGRDDVSRGEVLTATDRMINLPGNNKNLYDIYSVGPRENPRPGRIAHRPGGNAYYYSPYHYNATRDVPNAWIAIKYDIPK